MNASSPLDSCFVGLLASLRSFLGSEWARVQRRRKIPVNPAFLPPQLRSRPEADDFAPEGSLTATVPVTLYWGQERNVDLYDVGPQGIPHWLGRFDWVIGFEYGWADTDIYPRSVFCEPAYLPALLSYLKRRWPTPPDSGSFLASGAGPDYLLSWHRRGVITGLTTYFPSLYYEAKNIDFPGVAVMPIGFTEHYVRSNGPEVLALAQSIQRQAIRDGQTPSVLAAWGAWWPGLDGLIPDRAKARQFAESSSLVTHEQMASTDWFEALSTFDFMLCPLGNGVQAPKMVEALLMGCIPITTAHPTFVELQRRGMPILIVSEWPDITEETLRREYPALFARVWEFRRHLLDLDQWWSFSFPSDTSDAGAQSTPLP